MNNEDRTWFNQQMMYFKDSIYSNSVIDISLTSSTTDFKNFSPLGINISITSPSNRNTYSINYPNGVDLITTIKEIKSNITQVYQSDPPCEILKKYHNDKSLKISFKHDKNKDRVVLFTIVHSNTEQTGIVLPFYIFESFSGILKSFTCDYSKLSFDMINRTLLSQLYDQSKLIRNSIQILPSMVSNNETIKTNNIINEDNVDIKNVENVSSQIEDLDKFIGKEMENIKLEDQEKIEQVKTEIPIVSEFISKVLFNDLMNLEDLLNSLALSKNVYTDFEKIVKQNIQINSDLLPDISKDDFKSYMYLSKLIHDTHLRNYTDKGIPISPSLSIIKYIPSNVNHKSLDLAYDLLTIICYVKCLKNLIQSREEDSFTNKSIFFLHLRSFMDIFTFSFLDGKDPNAIKNAVLTRFKKFEEIGFFNKYNEILEMYNLNKVSCESVTSYVDLINDKIINKAMVIKDLHTTGYNIGDLRLPYENDLDLEQIINTVVPLEVHEKLGINIKDNEEILKITGREEIDKNILKYFEKEVKPKQRKEREITNNIYRFVNSNSTGIPSKFRSSFLTNLKSLNDENYDFNNPQFPIEELGDDIVKALYEWNESLNKKESYTDFFSKFENSLMTKDLIVVKVKSKNEDITLSGDWFFADE